MWYLTANGEDIRPAEIDSTSSKVYVYVRKKIERVPASDDVPAHYEWMEQKIPKKDWETYRMVLEHGSALDDVYAALTELAEMIVEG